MEDIYDELSENDLSSMEDEDEIASNDDEDNTNEDNTDEDQESSDEEYSHKDTERMRIFGNASPEIPDIFKNEFLLPTDQPLNQTTLFEIDHSRTDVKDDIYNDLDDEDDEDENGFSDSKKDEK